MPNPTALSRTECHRFADDGTIPNSALPLLVHRAALPADADAIEAAFAANAWPPAWRSGVYPWHHFHPSTHEALGVASGTARVLFGGPNGTEIAVSAGDVVVVPAGVGHCAITASDDLVIVGAYPAGATDRAASRGDPTRHAALRAAITAVPNPAADPALGRNAGLAVLWA